MKLYAPKYYKKFRCIADRCPHSCCIGWEIDVDARTLEKYQKLQSGYGAVLLDSIAMEDPPHFRLCEGDRCPHLDERGLCKIILCEGEDYLCDICREHPRFYNYTDIAEVGLGMSCIEAARLILTSPDYAESEEIGEADAETEESFFDGRAERGKLYAILQDESRDYAARLDEIYRTYGIAAGEDALWLKRIADLEYLDSDHKALFLSYDAARRPVGKDAYLERFLAYLIYRHCTEAWDESDFCDRLAFCLFCERLFASLLCVKGATDLEQIAVLAGILSEEIEYSNDNTQALTDEAFCRE